MKPIKWRIVHSKIVRYCSVKLYRLEKNEGLVGNKIQVAVRGRQFFQLDIPARLIEVFEDQVFCRAGSFMA